MPILKDSLMTLLFIHNDFPQWTRTTKQFLSDLFLTSTYFRTSSNILYHICNYISLKLRLGKNLGEGHSDLICMYIFLHRNRS